jgi:hypothetical protein
MNYREDCLREAEECDRLAGLASTLAVRNLMKLSAFQWRKSQKRQRNGKAFLAINAR